MMLLLKMVLCSAVIGLANGMLTDVEIGSWLSVALIGVSIAAIGALVERMMLRRGTLWLTTAADLGLAAAVVYLSQFVLADVGASVVGALLTGGLVAILEYFAHRSAIARMGFRWS